MKELIKRALISVSDKRGIIDISLKLVSLGIEIISTGGTAKVLSDAGINTIPISNITGFPECLDGRVKTLHPKIHGGLLAVRDNPLHMETLKELNIDTIDLVIVNLYPFKETIEDESCTLEAAIENIDIGGPSMLRAAAKNYKYVTVITDPEDYKRIIGEIENYGDVSVKTKLELSTKVFSHTAYYDTLIANYMRQKTDLSEFPKLLTSAYEKVQDLRYGENPHQKAAYYKEICAQKGALHNAVQLNGKELSFNNINDANGALELLKEFSEPACVAVKHANPCGVALGDDIYDAYIKAYDSDPLSIFGGIVAVNREIDGKTAKEMTKTFLEIIIAPEYTDEAVAIFKEKKNLRVLKLKDIFYRPTKAMELKKIFGGLLVQETDYVDFDIMDIKYVTNEKPSEDVIKDLIFAWKVVKHVKSNAIVIAKEGRTLGIGPGQTNRIWSAQMSITRAGEQSAGAVMASDAFFPFPDVVAAAAEAGIRAIIQPGGSLNDEKSIDMCNEKGIAMIFTGIRHFKH